jgi:putative ABC transport system substrate-binding protein
MPFDRLRRRDFISLLGCAAALPQVARAQQPRLPVVGFLGIDPLGVSVLRAFHQGLGEVGYVEGRNIVIEYRWAEGQYERLSELASELVRLQPAVIFTTQGVSGLAAKRATTTIPIVFNSGIDPVNYGLVASLNRPGSNITGVSGLSVELGPKKLELLHELAPKATTIASLRNPINPSRENGAALQAAARGLGLQLLFMDITSERELDSTFAMLVERGAGAVLVAADAFFANRSAQLAALALRYRLPTIFFTREAVAGGGLASYATNVEERYRLGGTYVGRILRGEKPADLPVQQPTKFDLIINLKTAKALGLEVPPPMLARADEVIE